MHIKTIIRKKFYPHKFSKILKGDLNFIIKFYFIIIISMGESVNNISINYW